MTNRRSRSRQKPQSWQELKSKHTNTRTSVRIPWDGAAADEAARLAADLPRVQEDDARENRDPQAPELARRIDELERRAKDSEVTFSFEGIGRRQYQMLIEAHPATPEQNETAGQRLSYNPDTFPPALMAASCVEPAELRDNLPEWEEIHDEWSTGQNACLWHAVVQANARVNEAPKSRLASTILAMNASEQN